MPQVSKNVLNEKLLKGLFLQLAELFSDADKKTSSKLFGELLTETEKVMIAKRLAVILMLAQGYSSYRIWKTLKMSKSTVSLIQHRFENGEYSTITQFVKKNKINSEKIWIILDLILRAGMPPMGKDRWKSLRL